ncbi:hypothetical protein KSX_87440 [Ktedonospora formicarum]|uniref:Alpha/beta hydrolase fold-3 domain-containing protein n=1 Tax=Ktedonospora formicarum TaxID=2778364 RepID=A0A8J3IAT4_9CHLR|nr:hypothetical protein KSX_87440 [Ktedonospora formicarum]
MTAYEWLRTQGFATSQIIIAGKSAGGNLTLTTALALRESHEALPAALVAISPAGDLTTAEPDPLLRDKVSKAYASYTNHGTVRSPSSAGLAALRGRTWLATKLPVGWDGRVSEERYGADGRSITQNWSRGQTGDLAWNVACLAPFCNREHHVISKQCIT